MKRCASIALLAWVCTAAPSFGQLILNPSQPITEQVTVQIIQTIHGSGAPTATVLGDSLQRAAIESLVDSIWAQAGIDVVFLPTVNIYQNTFAFQGTTSPRPTGDLSTIVTAGDLAGVGSANPLILDMYFVDVVPGFSFTTENTSNGLAFVSGNGIAMFVGDNLLTFQGGREVIASVISHEIGHNLGLDHIVESENLMQAGGSPNQGERLNALQISTALASNFSTPVAVPEPGTMALSLLGFAGAAVVWRRRRRAA